MAGGRRHTPIVFPIAHGDARSSVSAMKAVVHELGIRCVAQLVRIFDRLTLNFGAQLAKGANQQAK